MNGSINSKMPNKAEVWIMLSFNILLDIKTQTLIITQVEIVKIDITYHVSTQTHQQKNYSLEAIMFYFPQLL